MPDEQHGAEQPDNTPTQPNASLSETAGVPIAPQQSLPSVGQSAQSAAQHKDTATATELHWLEKLNFGGQLCLVIVGIIAVIVYGKQLGTMKEQLQQMVGSSQQTDRLLCLYEEQLEEVKKQSQDTHRLADQAKAQAIETKHLASATYGIAQTSKDALVQVQRAVIAVQTVDVSRKAGTDGKVASLLIFLRWRNVGATPTKDLKFRHSYFYDVKRLPQDFSYADLGGPETDTPSFAAPQGEVSALPIEIPVSLAKDIQDGKQVMTLWGHADYRDVFRGTPMHTSQYCFIIVGFYGNLYSASANETTVAATENCKTHNCHDEECKAK